MPYWVHRTNVDVLWSVAQADLPEVVTNYIEEPDLTGLADTDTRQILVDTIYWNIVGDIVSEMTQPEKDAVDAAIAAQNVLDAQSAAVAKVDIPATTGDEIPLEIRALINNANKRINYLTNRVEELFATMDTLLNGAGNASTRLNRIPPLHPNQSTQNPLTLPPNFSLIQTRGMGAAVQEYKDQINAGEADS